MAELNSLEKKVDEIISLDPISDDDEVDDEDYIAVAGVCIYVKHSSTGKFSFIEIDTGSPL